MPFIPHTEQDIQEMLQAIGVKDIEQLFDEIPAALCAKELTQIPQGLTEMEMSRLMQQRAAQDSGNFCFIGAGAYEHHIPAAVWEIATRGEFMTAYTPYQAEASQGTLQLLYEYQTMMASLTGMNVSNASLYDGASALAEAVLMAVRANRKAKAHRVLMPRTVHPAYRSVVKAIVEQQNIEVMELDYDGKSGATVMDALTEYTGTDFSALIIPMPNFFGVLEDVDSLTDWAHAQNALAIAVVNPTALGLLKEPGQWGQRGADIVCGEGQPLGIPLASGGPYFGFLCCRQEFVRQMPGRIIGCTVDTEGKRGFSLTLQAREQHIRRSKATSNICTNQGLAVTAATIYMSLLGPEGLRRVALASHQNALLLAEKLTQLPGIEQVFNSATFHEIVLRLPVSAEKVLQKLAAKKIQGGYYLGDDYPELKDCILLCATETKLEEDLEYFKRELAQLI